MKLYAHDRTGATDGYFGNWEAGALTPRADKCIECAKKDAEIKKLKETLLSYRLNRVAHGEGK